MTNTRIQNCPLCGKDRLRSLAPCAGGPIELCEACRLIFRNPPPDDEQLSRSYQKLYYPDDEGEVIYDATPKELLVQYADRLADRIGPFSKKRILDVGCGNGTFGALLTARGARVYGVEFDDVARARITTFQAYKTVNAVPDGKFDLIALIEVVEHMRIPWEEMAQLRARLTPGGWSLVTTPSLDGLRAQLQGSRWDQAENPTHLHLFSEETLTAVLSRAGFRTIERLRLAYDYPGHGGMRRRLNRILTRLGLDGHLQMFAR